MHMVIHCRESSGVSASFCKGLLTSRRLCLGSALGCMLISGSYLTSSEKSKCELPGLMIFHLDCAGLEQG